MTPFTVDVPGATLHAELRGRGPLLLLLGGAAGGGGLAQLTARLEEHYTVVTHDRRGLGASRSADPDTPVGLGTDADDVAALLAALTDDPVPVAGTSNGAVLGLELTARHPRRVRALVAHEPPLPELLPEPEREAVRVAQASVESALVAGDPATAADRLAALTGLAPVSHRAVDPRAAADRAAWMARVSPALHRHRLDVDAVAAAGVPVVVAAGTERPELVGPRSAAALAARLGVGVTTFPGGHAGFVSHPDEFLARLLDVLREVTARPG